MKFIVRLLLNACVFLIVSSFLPGFVVTGFWPALWAALIFGVINSLIRPVLLLVSLPVSVLTLGVFTLVIDAAVMALTSFFVSGFHISGFWAALLGWFLVSAGSTVISSILGGGSKRHEYSSD